MKFKIYWIIDINGLKYVGKTHRTLNHRLNGHIADKKYDPNKCSSAKLELDNCEIILLCECEEYEAKYREQYFKDNINCVNKNNPVLDKEKRKEYGKQYNQSEKRKKENKERNLFKKVSVVNGCYEFIQMLKQY